MRCLSPIGRRELLRKSAADPFTGISLTAAKNDVEAAAAAVALVRAANRGDPRGMTGRSQPVVDRSAYPPALHRRLARPLMAGNQEDEPVAGVDRPFERKVDRLPCTIEIVAVQVDHPVGLDRPAPKLPLPAGIEPGAEPLRGRRAD